MNQNELPTPELTFDMNPEPTSAQNILVKAEPAQATVPEPQLTPAEQKMVDDFSARIDLTNSSQILQFGAGAQKKMADFSESALENVRTKDLGEVGQMLSGVVAELKSFERFKRTGRHIEWPIWPLD